MKLPTKHRSTQRFNRRCEANVYGYHYFQSRLIVESGTSAQTIELLDQHNALWEQLYPMIVQNRIPQGLLFVGPLHANKIQFVNRFIAAVICQDKSNRPCGHCSACHLHAQRIHPDIVYVGQETPQDKGIKIEHIRDLQQNSYQTPKRSEYRFFILEPADKLNIYAANALLKTLEEPSKHTKLILLAEQVSSVLPTILSRCQRYTFTTPALADYLLLGNLYRENTVRYELLQQIDIILAKLCDLIKGNVSPCTLAAEWVSYPLNDLLWFFYLLTAQAIHYPLKKRVETQSWTEKLQHFSSLIHPVTLFNQLDKINVLVRKINHNINMNSTLAVEDLLLGYMR